MRLIRFGSVRLHGDPWDDEPGDDRVVAALAAYVGTLPADEAVLARSRVALRGAFAESVQARVTPLPSKREPAFERRRLVLAGTIAALLLVGSVGGALAESGPGEPFYRIRLDVEALTLPQRGTPQRLTADLDRTEARLEEAAGAARSRDWRAESDAVDAYTDIVAGLTDTPEERGTVRTALTAQLEVLLRLRENGGASAGPALDRAIALVRARVETQNAPPSSPQPQQPAAGGTADGDGGDGVDASSSGSASQSAGPGRASDDAGGTGPAGPGSGSTAAPAPNGTGGGGQGGSGGGPPASASPGPNGPQPGGGQPGGGQSGSGSSGSGSSGSGSSGSGAWSRAAPATAGRTSDAAAGGRG